MVSLPNAEKDAFLLLVPQIPHLTEKSPSLPAAFSDVHFERKSYVHPFDWWIATLDLQGLLTDRLLVL